MVGPDLSQLPCLCEVRRKPYPQIVDIDGIESECEVAAVSEGGPDLEHFHRDVAHGLGIAVTDAGCHDIHELSLAGAGCLFPRFPTARFGWPQTLQNRRPDCQRPGMPRARLTLCCTRSRSSLSSKGLRNREMRIDDGMVKTEERPSHVQHAKFEYQYDAHGNWTSGLSRSDWSRTQASGPRTSSGARLRTIPTEPAWSSFRRL